MRNLAHSAPADKTVDLWSYEAVAAKLRDHGALESTIRDVAEHLTLPTYLRTPNGAAVLIEKATDRRFAIADWLRNDHNAAMLLIPAELLAGDAPILLARRTGDAVAIGAWWPPTDTRDYLATTRTGFDEWPEAMLRDIARLLAQWPEKAIAQGWRRG